MSDAVSGQLVLSPPAYKLSLKAVRLLLHYLYTGEVAPLEGEGEVALQLLANAGYLSLIESKHRILVQCCAATVLGALTPDNCLTLLHAIPLDDLPRQFQLGFLTFVVTHYADVPLPPPPPFPHPL